MPLPGPTLLPGPELLPGTPEGGSAFDWRPTVLQVAILIRARTVERATNNFAGTFTENTRPTALEAEQDIDTAVDDVLAETGAIPVGIQAEAAKAVRSLIALRAAMIIERSYYPEQVGTNKSAFTALERDWDKRLPAVVQAVKEAEAGEIIPGDPDDSGGTGTPAVDRDVYVPASARLYSRLGAWIGSGTAEYTFPDDAPGGTISGDTKF